MFVGYSFLAMFLLFLDMLDFVLSSQQNKKRVLTTNNIPHQIVKQRLTLDALLVCNSSNEEDLEQIEWWFKRIGAIYIGNFNVISRFIFMIKIIMRVVYCDFNV
jgi:hypothetical protein